jgi:glucose dehydrogenase
MERIFGGSPLAVLVRLVVISVILGIVLAALNISPLDFVANLQRMAIAIWNMGFDWFGSIGRWFVAGAVIVFPIWLIVRLLGLAKGGAGPRPPGSQPPRSPSPFKDR